MTKFSSFKEQQLLTEGWRTYMVEQQPISQPPQQQPPQHRKNNNNRPNFCVRVETN
jgi:hypothetical protein